MIFTRAPLIVVSDTDINLISLLPKIIRTIRLQQWPVREQFPTFFRRCSFTNKLFVYSDMRYVFDISYTYIEKYRISNLSEIGHIRVYLTNDFFIFFIFFYECRITVPTKNMYSGFLRFRYFYERKARISIYYF